MSSIPSERKPVPAVPWLTLVGLICAWIGIAAEARSKSLIAKTIVSIARRQPRPVNGLHSADLSSRVAIVFLTSSVLLLLFARRRERTKVFPFAVGSLILGILWMFVLV